MLQLLTIINRQAVYLMQKDSKIFDDFARLASGAAGTFMDMKREVEAMVMDKVEKLLGRMNLVRREEFEVVRLMAEQARVKQEQLEEKIAYLEKLLESQGSREKPAPRQPKK
jgi:BMFP domain-containing protein YqiC